MVREGGAMPVVVLNKADLCADPSAEAAALRHRLPSVDVVIASALTGEGLEAVGQIGHDESNPTEGSP